MTVLLDLACALVQRLVLRSGSVVAAGDLYGALSARARLLDGGPGWILVVRVLCPLAPSACTPLATWLRCARVLRHTRKLSVHEMSKSTAAL